MHPRNPWNPCSNCNYFHNQVWDFLGAIGRGRVAAAPVNTDVGFFVKIQRLDISKTVHGKRLLTTENTEVTEGCWFVSVFSVTSVVFISDAKPNIY